MSSLLTTLGLQGTGPLTPPLSHTSGYIIFHFLFAYAALASRLPKQYYGIDHNVSPREDIVKYGPKAVASGKVTQKQLNMLKRIESAHANSVEHFPMFVGAMIWAHVAGLPTTEINASALAYTVARVAYAAAYILVETVKLSQLRAINSKL
ncbi:hypothetical protein LTR85_007385 [Meristemomyces frigidus]|nr:hypothetical protein LTR85_007385 [Meristemomyces frigidus]